MKEIKNQLSLIILLTLIISHCSIFSVSAYEHRVVKVGFPEFQGFSNIEKDGSYSGYTYEYLQEIAKYTGWEYEFVTIPSDSKDVNNELNKMLNMLQNGDIDIMGGVLLNEQTEKMFDFTEYNCGSSYATLSVLPQNIKYDETNYATFNGMTVGVLENAKQRNLNFKNFCKSNGITVNIKSFKSENERTKALENHDIDAILSGDIILTEKRRVLAKFAEQPYYFVTTKGNSKILSGLNSSISKINEINPHYATKLYDKYFRRTDKYNFYLSDDEKKYIKKSKKLTVVFHKAEAPIQYYDDEKESFSGISADIFKRISEKTGLMFEFVETKTYKDALNMVSKGKADIIAGISDDYVLAQKYNVTLTKSYLLTQNVMVKNIHMDMDDINNKKLALPRGYKFTNNANKKNIVYYDNIKDCLEAINTGKADYTYSNAYSVEYYARNRYKNISMTTLTDSERGICIGVSKPTNIKLLTIINKAVQDISENQLQSIVYNNTMLNDNKITFKSFVYSNPTECIMVVILTSFLIIIVFVKYSRKIALDKERYNILSEVSGEFIYEYDFTHDMLTLSEKFADYFGCETTIRNYRENFKHGKKHFKGEEDLFLRAFDEMEQNINREIECQLVEGKTEWFRSICTIIFNKKNLPTYAIGKLTSIEKEKQEKEFLLIKSQNDSLTGIYNRSACEEKISEYIKTKESNIFSVLMLIDLDNFKAINDNLGHKVGDDVLKDLSMTLSAIFRKSDIIGRLGGDEFIVFMKDIYDKNIVIEKAEVLLKKMDKSVGSENKSYPISLSIGIAITKEKDSFNELYEKSDKALYQVKEEGRNNFKFI